MSSRIQLIVGLANPGQEYADTRHNAGAWYVEALAANARASLRFQAKFHGLYALAQCDQQPCHLLIPNTFMNLSGQAVRACMSYYKIPPNEVLIAHDEIDLPTGTVKLKFDGGDGGHNGLKDIIRHLSTKQFYRLRIGVGHPGHSKDVSDYVLTAPSKADKQKIESAIDQALTITPELMQGELQKAMQRLHTET